MQQTTAETLAGRVSAVSDSVMVSAAAAAVFAAAILVAAAAIAAAAAAVAADVRLRVVCFMLLPAAL